MQRELESYDQTLRRLRLEQSELAEQEKTELKGYLYDAHSRVEELEDVERRLVKKIEEREELIDERDKIIEKMSSLIESLKYELSMLKLDYDDLARDFNRRLQVKDKHQQPVAQEKSPRQYHILSRFSREEHPDPQVLSNPKSRTSKANVSVQCSLLRDEPQTAKKKSVGVQVSDTRYRAVRAALQDIQTYSVQSLRREVFSLRTIFTVAMRTLLEASRHQATQTRQYITKKKLHISAINSKLQSILKL